VKSKSFSPGISMSFQKTLKMKTFKQKSAFFSLIFFFNLLFTQGVLLAQLGNISGRILNNNEPLAFANVLLLSANDSTLVKGDLTDENGAYSLVINEVGNYFIKAEIVGFTPQFSENIAYKSGDISLPDLQLSEGHELSEITVSAQKPLIELRADKMVVNVANSSINSGQTALEILAKSPGISIDNQNNISLKGNQGVLVTIDGKNQYLSNEDITRMLATMPASGINSIEIITNPSSKHDAEGNSGIINIVLQKNENFGTNGQLSTTFRKGIKASHFHNLSVNHRREKFSIQAAGEYYNWGAYRNLLLYRNIPSVEGNTVFDSDTKMHDSGDGFNLRLGADYYLTENTTIGIMAKINNGDEEKVNDNLTKITGVNKPDFSQLLVDSDALELYQNTTYNFNFEHKFPIKKMQISFDADYNTHQKTADWSYKNQYKDENTISVNPDDYLHNDQKIDIDIFATKTDFSWNISDKIQLETGLKHSQVSTKNSTYFEYLEGGNWINQTNRSNTFDYTESVSAAYLNTNIKIKKVSIQAGLRAEHTISEGISETLNQEVTRQYTNLFPSMSISHPIAEGQNMSYSYSRRLNRPNYRKLNPFVFYLDEFTLGKGNPFLNPQYTNALSINYALDNKLYISASYNRTNDLIEQVIEQNNETNTTISTTDNLDVFNNMSLTVTVPKVWTNWWTTRLNYTGFYIEFYAPVQAGILDNSTLAHQVYLSNEFSLSNDWSIELSGNYHSRSTWGFFTAEARGNVDAGISKKLGKNGRIKAGITDIFWTQNSKAFVAVGDIDLMDRSKFDTRRVSVSANWNFGNNKIKGARNRKTASEDERGRL